MIKEGKIGVQEAVAVVSITIANKVYLTSPALVTLALGPAATYMTLISALTAMLGFTFILMLLKRFPGKDITEAFNLSVGRIPGFIFSFALLLFILTDTAMILREFAEVIKIYTLPLTPPSFVIGTLLFGTVIACFLGLETITRTARLSAYFLLAGYLIVVVLAINNYDFHNLFPILGYGLKKTLITGASRSTFYGEVIGLAIIASSLQGIDHIKKAGYISLILTGIIASLTLVTTLMALNYSTAEETTSRVYELAKLIHVGGFLQRLDPIFVLIWCLGTLIYISFMFYCTVSTYCKAFRIQDMRPSIIPAAVVLFTVSMIPNDLRSVVDISNTIKQNGWIIIYGLPLLALIIAVLRKKKEAS